MSFETGDPPEEVVSSQAPEALEANIPLESYLKQGLPIRRLEEATIPAGEILRARGELPLFRESPKPQMEGHDVVIVLTKDRSHVIAVCDIEKYVGEEDRESFNLREMRRDIEEDLFRQGFDSPRVLIDSFEPKQLKELDSVRVDNLSSLTGGKEIYSYEGDALVFRDEGVPYEDIL